MSYKENVARLQQSIAEAIDRAKSEGIVGMSQENMRQCISFRGCDFPNGNTAERAFAEALSLVDPKGFRIYHHYPRGD